MRAFEDRANVLADVEVGDPLRLGDPA